VKIEKKSDEVRDFEGWRKISNRDAHILLKCQFKTKHPLQKNLKVLKNLEIIVLFCFDL
jgi:hypothetical protein